MVCTDKNSAFWITFTAYLGIHGLRMCYSFNKVNIKRQFQLSQFYLGILDALLYLTYAFGVLIRYQLFQGNTNMKKLYFITSTMISVCFGLVAYISLFQHFDFLSTSLAQIILTIGIAGFGFFHFAVYQIMGSIVDGYHDSKTQSAKLGFWGSATSLGNIVGFFVSNLIIHRFHIQWQVTYFIFAIFNLIMGFIVYFVVKMPVQDQSYKQQLYLAVESNKNISIKQGEQPIRQIRMAHWFAFIKRIFSDSSEARYTYGAYITIKATVYTFLMWFPIFLVSKNLQGVSGYVSTLFDLGGTIGGYLIGKLHEVHYYSQNDQKNENKGFFNTILRFRNVFFILMVTSIIIAFMNVTNSLAIYCPLTFGIGFFLGGTYNNISSHEIFKISQNRLLYTDMLLNASVGISCFMIGLVQLVMAFLLKFNSKQIKPGQKGDYGMFFVLLLIIMVICTIIMWRRAIKNDQNKKQKIKNEQQVYS